MPMRLQSARCCGTPARVLACRSSRVATGWRLASFCLPLLVALLLAARSRLVVKKLTLGYLLLLVPQTFSLVFELLRQIMTVGGRSGGLNISQWQMEGIAMGYQVGSLVLLWLWLERQFFAAVVLDGLMRRHKSH